MQTGKYSDADVVDPVAEEAAAPKANSGFAGPIQDAYDNFMEPMSKDAPAGTRMADDFGRGVLKTFGDPVFHPIATAKSLVNTAKHPVDTARGIAAGIKADPTRAVPEMLGGIAGAGLAAPAAETAIRGIEAFPTTAKAGRMFDAVGEKVGNSPVPLTRTTPALEQAQRLSDYGHGTVTPVDRLFQRSQTINPIEYPEARGRYTPLTRLTASDSMNATPQLKAATRGVAKGLNADIREVAEQHGVGDLYDKGQRMYGQAQTLKTVGKNAAKVGVAGAVGYPLYSKIRSVLP